MVSFQAAVAAVGYILVAIALFIPVKPADEKKATEYEYRMADRFVVLLVMLIPMALSVYTIDCMVEGQCQPWAWVNSVMVFVWSVVIFVVSIVGALKGAMGGSTEEAKPATATA